MERVRLQQERVRLNGNGNGEEEESSEKTTYVRRPSIKGRTNAIYLLDRMIAKGKNQHKLEKAFQEEFDEDPFKFFKDMIMPFVPRDKITTKPDHTAGSTNLTPDQIVSQMDQVTLGMTDGSRPAYRPPERVD